MFVTMEDPKDRKNPSNNAVTSSEDIETAKWTRHLPEAFGIRAAVQNSPYRWCVRESAMWGIATGTAMTLHRFRMKSRPIFAANVGFTSFFVVYLGSYYFGVKRRDYQQQMIELMMKVNSFEHALNMPEQMPMDEHHPFVEPDVSGKGEVSAESQYVANIPERKEWQPSTPARDASEVFRPSEKS